MSGIALFDALQDFGRIDPPAAALGGLRMGFGDHQAPAAPLPEVQMPDIDAIVREAVEQAEAALEQRLTTAHEQVIETERQRHAAEMDAMLWQFGEQAGELIATRLAEMEGRVGDLAATGAARILGSVLSDELQKRSIASLSAAIRGAATDHDAVRITVRGPQFLLERLAASLGEHAGKADLVEAAGFDLTAAIDGDLFETRLAEWSAALSDILA